MKPIVSALLGGVVASVLTVAGMATYLSLAPAESSASSSSGPSEMALIQCKGAQDRLLAAEKGARDARGSAATDRAYSQMADAQNDIKRYCA